MESTRSRDIEEIYIIYICSYIYVYIFVYKINKLHLRRLLPLFLLCTSFLFAIVQSLMGIIIYYLLLGRDGKEGISDSRIICIQCILLHLKCYLRSSHMAYLP